ncbi:MAG: glycerophosphodiester phosphodiesterase [Proteobacteria bacterium]|nr:glycerophosphodiester phosphodiesterase [Pseudomonadota bacterium]
MSPEDRARAFAALGLPRVIGHRGAAGHAPENTLAGLVACARLGARWAEVDVRLTACGRPVLLHDETLERTTGGRGPVAERPYAEIAALDAGAWFSPAFTGERIPTLTEALACCRRLGLGLNVEVKPCPGREAEAAAVLARSLSVQPGVAVLASSFAAEVLAALAEAAPGLARGLVIERAPRPEEAEALAPGVVSLHVAERTLTPAGARALKGAGFGLLAYTVNGRRRGRALLFRGVDAVISDYPDRLLSLA